MKVTDLVSIGPSDGYDPCNNEGMACDHGSMRVLARSRWL